MFRLENEEVCLRKSRNDSIAGLAASDKRRSAAPCCPCCYFYRRCCQWVHFLSQSCTPCGHTLARLVLHWSRRQRLLHFQQIKKTKQNILSLPILCSLSPFSLSTICLAPSLSFPLSFCTLSSASEATACDSSGCLLRSTISIKQSRYRKPAVCFPPLYHSTVEFSSRRLCSEGVD